MKTVEVELIGDMVAEANEFFNLVFTPTGAIANGSAGAVGKAETQDDDTSGSVPEVSITAGRTVEGNSGAVTLQFDVTLSEASGNQVTLDFRTISGTVDGAFDFGKATGNGTFDSASFAPGQTSRTISINISEDGLDEADSRAWPRPVRGPQRCRGSAQG